MTRVVLATKNKGKAREFSEALTESGIELVTLGDLGIAGECDETGSTFEENALLKARWAVERTGLPSLADDSGLVVDALGGCPGVRSARYAGPAASDPENNALLLKNLASVPAQERTARFICVLALALPGGESMCCAGTCEGIILGSPRGTGGSGYDPLFLVPELGKTFAELQGFEKHDISHRGRALVNARQTVFQLLSSCT